MRRFGVAVALAVVGAAMFVAAPPALAACHAFTVRAEPARAAEGGKVTVTVTRDAGVNPSQIDVSTVDVTAKGGEDFPAVKRTVSFTTETQQSFDIPVTDDQATEGDETFRLHLSNPGGCAVNPNFTVGPDATVTIVANDATATTAPSPGGATTSRPTTTATTTSSATTASTAVEAGIPTSTEGTAATTTTTTEPTASDDEALSPVGDDDDGEDDDGAGGLLIVAALLAAGAVGGAGYMLYRRRPGPG